MKPDPDPLEKAIDQTLRGLPARRAPGRLEARVLAEIARREALPWWHRSWAYWPPAVRWAFLALSAGLCATTIFRGMAFFQSSPLGVIGRVLARPGQRFAAIDAAMHTTLGVAGELFRLIPPHWLYGGTAIVALLYATVFLAGAAAYRTLWQPR